MKGIRFYADLAGTPGELSRRTTRRALRELAARGDRVNCVAVFTGAEHCSPGGAQEALVATFMHYDSDVSVSSVTWGYLDGCRHIDEATARKLHPRLFVRLDSE